MRGRRTATSSPVNKRLARLDMRSTGSLTALSALASVQTSCLNHRQICLADDAQRARAAPARTKKRRYFRADFASDLHSEEWRAACNTLFMSASCHVVPGGSHLLKNHRTFTSSILVLTGGRPAGGFAIRLAAFTLGTLGCSLAVGCSSIGLEQGKVALFQ